MKISFNTTTIDDKLEYQVDAITFGNGNVFTNRNSQFHNTQEAAVIQAMISLDADPNERNNPNFVNHATRMTLRMIGSDSAY